MAALLPGGCARYISVPPQTPAPTRIGIAAAEVLDASSLRVLVWNVYKGKRPSWAAELRRLSANRDLVVTQELLVHPNSAALLEALSLEWTLAASFVYRRRDNTNTGLGTAARAPAQNSEALRSEGREPFTHTPKLALLTHHRLSDGSVLLVANVHAINFAGYAPFQAQLRQVAARIRVHDGPVLMAGDFNTWSSRRRARLREVAAQLNLEAVRFDPDPRLRRLDHAFVRGLDVVHSEVHAGRGSDHLALSFELRRP